MVTATYTITNDGRPISNTISIGNGGSGFSGSTVSLTIGAPNASHNAVQATATGTIGYGLAAFSQPTSQQIEIDISSSGAVNGLTLDGDIVYSSGGFGGSYNGNIAVNEDISGYPSSVYFYLDDNGTTAVLNYTGKNTSGGPGNHFFTMSSASIHTRAFTFTSGSTLYSLNPNTQSKNDSTLVMTVAQTGATSATVKLGYERSGSKYYLRSGSNAYNITNAGVRFTSGGTKTVSLALDGLNDELWWYITNYLC